MHIRFQISIDVYASVEFGCVAVGEKNRVRVSAVQVGCEIVVPVPIVNTTRHRIRYCVRDVYDRRLESGATPPPPSSVYSGGAGGHGMEPETEEIEEEPETIEESDDIGEDDGGGESTITTVHERTVDPTGRFSPETRTTAIGDGGGGRLPAFEFDEIVGQLGPNEAGSLNLFFRPYRPRSYALRAKCYVMCEDFPGVVSVLPVVVTGSGCETRLEVRTQRQCRSRHAYYYAIYCF